MTLGHRLWSAYLAQLHQHPVRVKACTSCTTFTITDVIAQSRERRASTARTTSRRPQHDVMRTVRSGAFGLLWLGPLNHIFWGRTKPFGLEYWFPGPSWPAVMSRVAIDQATNMPLNMVAFLAWPHLLQGEFAAAISNVRQSFWPSFTFALSIWPWVHPLSFRYVPLEHRLLVLNVCSLGVFSYATWVSERRGVAGGEAKPEGGRIRRLPQLADT